MKALDLSTQSIVQLAILQAEEQQNIDNITRILAKVDEMCQEESGMSLDELIDNHDYCIERLDALSKEKKYRLDNAVDKQIEARQAEEVQLEPLWSSKDGNIERKFLEAQLDEMSEADYWDGDASWNE